MASLAAPPTAAPPRTSLRNAGAGPFPSVYSRYFAFVYASAKYLGAGPDAIDDIVQEVFLVIHAKFQTRQHPVAARSWIYGVVRRIVSTHRRSNRVRAGLEARIARCDVSSATVAETPLELAQRSARLELLASLLAELDEPKREVFMAAELEELTVPEIAEALEIPLNTAYSRLRAARQSFEERLARRVAREK